MKFGFVPRRLMGIDEDIDLSRPFDEWIKDLETLIKTAEKAGFEFMAMASMQSLPYLARYAAIPTKLRFANETLTLPMLDPVQLAPAVAHVDRMLGGRLDFGVSIGFQQWDLEAAGITRKDRVPKFMESIEVIKAMWTQDEVSYHGKYFDFEGLRPGVKPYQQPHPPIIVSSQAHGSAARAGRMADGLCVAPAVGHDDCIALCKTFREAYLETHNEEPTIVGARRHVMIGKDPEDGTRKAKSEQYFQFGPDHRYVRGRMQESTTVRLRLTPGAGDAQEFAFCGNYQQVAEGLARVRDEAGLTHVTCSFIGAPESFSARLEYLQGFGEEVILKLR